MSSLRGGLKAQKFATDHNYQDAMRHASSVSQSLSHSTNNEEAKRLASDVSGSFEKGISQRDEAAKSYRQSEDYSQQAQMTMAASSTINYNASQQFKDWLSDQKADNSPDSGRIGEREATRIIATDPGLTKAYASRYMQQAGLNPVNNVSSSAGSIKSSYISESSHNKYTASNSDMDNVRAQSESISFGVDRAIEQDTNQQISAQRSEIANQSSSISNQGHEVERHVNKEQGKGVFRRVGSKGIKEVKNIGDAIDSSINDAKKWVFGDAQQK